MNEKTNKFTKEEIIQSIKELWKEEYGDMNDNFSRNGYFVIGFVKTAIEKMEEDE